MVFARSSYDWSGKLFGRREDGASEIQTYGSFRGDVAVVPAVGIFGFQILVVYRSWNGFLYRSDQRI